MPYIVAGSGADTATRHLAAGLESMGINVILQPFHHYFEFFPALLSKVPAPPKTDIVLTNTWSGFAFSRPRIRMVAIDRLFILDPLLERYKSVGQRLYHNNVIRRYVLGTIRAADSVVAVSDYTARTISRVFGIPKPQVILNAVDTSFFTPPERTRSDNDGNPVRLLFIGNLSSRKGADLLSPIMERLGSGFELHIAGLRPTNTNRGRVENIKLLGRLSEEEVREQYRQADMLLFPSRGEGLPRAVMESLACGTPVVAANVSSLPEAVTPSVGRLCPVDDVGAFADTVRELASDPGQLREMGLAARAHAKQKFDLQRMAEEYIELFRGLLGKTSHVGGA